MDTADGHPNAATRTMHEAPGTESDAILAQYHAAEYSMLMGRVSSWENLQYAAWPILLGALALLADVTGIPPQYRWWAALVTSLATHVAYQGTMVNMLFSVLVVERDLRPRAARLLCRHPLAEEFWIYERVRERTFPGNPAWWPHWPFVISLGITLLVAGHVVVTYGLEPLGLLSLLAAVALCAMVLVLTRNGTVTKRQIVESCQPAVALVARRPSAPTDESVGHEP